MEGLVVRALGEQRKMREVMIWHLPPACSENISEPLCTEKSRQNLTRSSSSGTIKAALDPGDR